MNAYELAKKLEWYTNYDEFVEAGALLRQQADRIAELEKQLNTPKTYVLDGKQVFDTTPQIKELSDEEIIEIRQNTKASSTNNWADSLSFARAILKKASEK